MIDFLLNTLILDKPLWMWAGFLIVVLVLLVFDLGVLHKKSKEIEVKESLMLSGFYVAISLVFGLWVWAELGQESALEYYTGYVIEKSLSMDNIFVMAVIFSAFSIPRALQHRVLFWGILGVIVMRGIMIGVGAALVHEFSWVLYLFAAFLVFTGIKLFFWDEGDEDHEDIVHNSRILKFLRKNFRITEELHGDKFTVRKDGQLYITPLLLTLVTIEFADVIFAVDSVPAIFAITDDTFIVYTSNIFAILGLRALYFALAAMMARFEYLKYAVSLILVFIGAKVFAPLVLPIDKVPAELSLSVTISLLVIGVVYSLHKTKDNR